MSKIRAKLLPDQTDTNNHIMLQCMPSPRYDHWQLFIYAYLKLHNVHMTIAMLP